MRILTWIKFASTQTRNGIYITSEIVVPRSSRNGGEIGGIVEIVRTLILRAAGSGNGIIINGICYGGGVSTLNQQFREATALAKFELSLSHQYSGCAFR